MLGEGCFGVVLVVLSCTHRDRSGTFAVKMVDKYESPTHGIEREVYMLREFAHPAVVKLYDVSFENVFAYMVMQHCKGGDLLEGMQTHWKVKGQIPIQTVQRVTKHLLESNCRGRIYSV